MPQHEALGLPADVYRTALLEWLNDRIFAVDTEISLSAHGVDPDDLAAHFDARY